ncbi:MAG: ATP-binding protein [Peptococcaceae bacterium]|jgi:hypothetical protein|nr:ATP-binding protein [Peptococcaceae bacterium]
MPEKPKKIPYGISNYRMIALDGYVYVDKTGYIERLEQYGAPYLFFLRPRRFGKSLFTSVLNCYYDAKEKDCFDAYFSGTYIGEHPTELRNRYLMLNFDFSGVDTDTPEGMVKSFGSITRRFIDLFTKKYGIDYVCREDDMPGDTLDGLLSAVEMETRTPVYVVIDEYDHFANELLSFRIDLFKESVSKTGFVRRWFEILKKYTKTSVARIFATGVSPITLDSLTSGFNIAADITMDARFNGMMGFTEDEVRGIIRSAAEFPGGEGETDALMKILAGHYNGYLFSKDGDTRMFNSNMILYYLNSYLMTGKAPGTLIDKNLASDYAKLGNMFDLADDTGGRQVLEAILSGETVSAVITEQFSMEWDFTEEDLASLLFYMGLLTIDTADADGSVNLKVPNTVMKELYFTYFIKKLEDEAKFRIQSGALRTAMEDIASAGSNGKFVSLMEELLRALSNRDYRHFNETHIRLIMYAYLSMSRLFTVKSEYEVPGGYIDIALLPNNRYSVDYYAIIELKYVKKGEYQESGGKAAEAKLAEAAAQLNRYAPAPELTALPKLKKWALVFAGDQCVVNEEI